MVSLRQFETRFALFGDSSVVTSSPTPSIDTDLSIASTSVVVRWASFTVLCQVAPATLGPRNLPSSRDTRSLPPALMSNASTA